MTSLAFLPSLRRSPPFSAPIRINWANPLTRRLRALFVGADQYEYVNGIKFDIAGSPARTIHAEGVCAYFATGSDFYTVPDLSAGTKYDTLYDPVAPPITLFLIGRAPGNYGCGIARGNGSSLVSFGLGIYHGSADGAWGNVQCSTNLQLGPSVSNWDETDDPGMAVLSVGATTTNLWSAPYRKPTILQADSGSTPSGNFYYETGSFGRTFGLGAYPPGSQTSEVALAGMIVGIAWTRQQAQAWMNNPWQLLEPS